MKYLISLILSLLISTSVSGEQKSFGYTPRVEATFQKFFGSSVDKAESYVDGVEIIGEKFSESPGFGIPLTLNFNIDKDVEKVLLLNAGGNHYNYDGRYNDECAKEPVTVFSYIEKTKSYPKKLRVLMKTKCNRHPITLLLWVKTTSGDFYRASFQFRTSSSS